MWPKIAFAVFAIILYFLLRAFLKKWKQTQALDRGGSQAQGEIAARLHSVSEALGGRLVEGPALETSKGKLALLATRAPQDPAIDVTKLTIPLQSPYAVTVIPIEDAAKALQTKSLHPVDGIDPSVAAAFKVLSSDADFGRRVAVPELVDRLRELAKVVQARARLQVAPSGATVLVERGMTTPKELQGFHDGAALVVEAFRKLAGG
jgi:hypothetical protein